MTESDPVPPQPAVSDPSPEQEPQPTPTSAGAPSPPPGGSGTAAILRQRGGLAAWLISLALAAVLGALLFAGGYLVAGGGQDVSCSAPTQAFKSFCEAYDKLKSEYVDSLDDSKLARGAIQGMFQYGVGDPFSAYMPPDQYQQTLGELSGKFSGIGAVMSVKNVKDPADLAACTQLSDTCVLVVQSPIAGSPAEKAGIQPGDVVIAVNGTSVKGSTINDQVTKVRGPSGTQVALTLERKGRRFDLTITRAPITMPEVTSKLLTGHIGYITLHEFSESSDQEFHDALKGILAQGATKIVFDLRDNPGGYILAAQKIASEFVSSGLIFSQESAGGSVKRWDAIPGGLATDPKIPLVVLVNSGSASASEIVSGALKELGRATLIGEHTYGKNTVQIFAPLTDNEGGVRITISRWFTPQHHSVHPDGVQPTIAVTIPAGTPPEKDLVLDRALAYLATQVGTPSASTPASGSPVAALPVTPLVSWDTGGLRRAIA